MKKIYESIVARARAMTDEQFSSELQSHSEDFLACAFSMASEIDFSDDVEVASVWLGSSELHKHMRDIKDDFLMVKDEDFEAYSYAFSLLNASNDSSFAIAA